MTITDKKAKLIGNILKINWDEIDFEQFKNGLSIEFDEHGKKDPQTDVTHDDFVKAGKIALAHLKELPDYYTRLKKMEIKEHTVQKTPINTTTISDKLINKLCGKFGVDVRNVTIDAIKQGMIYELDKMQTYTLQALNADKVARAFNNAFQNILSNPAAYTNAVNEDLTLTEKRTFDFRSFVKMSPKQQFDFLSSLPKNKETGMGSSRMVFIVGAGKAIKFAMNKAGIAQNREELKNFRKLQKFSNMIPEIYDSDPKYQWLLVELVKPLSSNMMNDKTADSKFKSLTGLDFETFAELLEDFFTGGEATVHPRMLNNEFFKIVINMIKSSNLDWIDLTSMRQWGITASGNLVLLDYGFNDAVSPLYTNGTAAEFPESFYESTMKLSNVYKSFLLEKKFLNFAAFKAMDPKSQVIFLQKNGQFLGEGSSRSVYLVDGKTVIKLAKNVKGIAQNKEEEKFSKDPELKGLFTKIYDHSSDFRWLHSELARPLVDGKDFKSITGMPWNRFLIELRHQMEHFENVKNDYEEMGKPFNGDKVLNTIKNPLILTLVHAIHNKKLLFGDVCKFSSWGKTSDGRIVMLDYGFTEEVFDTHYDNSRPSASSNAVTFNGA